MISKKSKSPQTLAEWLDLATDDLVPSVQARVRADIKAQFAEAVQAYSANGLSEVEARAAALAGLGDADAADRRFRQKHLTFGDWGSIRLLRMADQLLIPVALNVAILVQATQDWDKYHNPLWTSYLPGWLYFVPETLQGTTGMALSLFTFYLAWRPATLANTLRFLLCRMIRAWGFLLIILLSQWGVCENVTHGLCDNPVEGITSVLCGLTLAGALLPYCLGLGRLRNKLLVAGEDWNNLDDFRFPLFNALWLLGHLLFRPRTTPEKFSDWLGVATACLLPSAKARIRAEIEAHYTESVQAHLARGLTEAAAQAAALADLGDARAAGRRLRQKHMSVFDAIDLRGDLKSDRKSISYSNSVVLLLTAGAIWYLHLHHQLGYYFLPDWLLAGLLALMGVVGLPLNIYSHGLAGQPATSATLRRYLALRFLRSFGGLTLWLLLAWVQWLDSADVTTDVPVSYLDRLMIVAILLTLPSQVMTILGSLRLRRKLRTAGEDVIDLDDPSPRDPSSA